MADLTVVKVLKPVHQRFLHYWVLVEARPSFGDQFEKMLMFKTKPEAEKVAPGYRFKE